ncbi:MAG: hypothetical protein C0478_16485, partial [Planctomyces sp.]|nr:hypothetical protein [Planctomyces sp.]
MTLLWHHDQPIGICVFTSAPLSLRLRNQYFGLSSRWTRTGLQLLDQQICRLARVVIHPTYRGAGLAAPFVRASCRHVPWPWIESLAEMGQFHTFFEQAGFLNLGECSPTPSSTSHQTPRTEIPRTRAAHSQIYGTRSPTGHKRLLTPETYAKSRHARPLYFLFDNRTNFHNQ